MKKLLSILLVLCLVLPGIGVFAEESTGLPEMNTTDPITLTFFDTGWGYNHAMSRLMAKAFMEKYPNITINVVNLPGDHNGYEEALTNELANGTKFDMARGFAAAERNTSSKLMYDCTEFVKADPDYADLAPALAAGGWYGTDHCFSFPGATVDEVLFVDINYLENMNVPVPSRDWTLEDFYDFIDQAHDTEKGMFAFTGSAQGGEMMDTLITPNAKASAGWDGQNIDMKYQAEAYATAYEWFNDGVYTWNGTDVYKSFVPDDAWGGISGRFASYCHYWDNFPTMLDPAWNQAYGIKYVPYMPPVSGEVENAGTLCQTTYYFISADCEHPREAYEALKWIIWGKEGWMYRLQNNYFARACKNSEGYYLSDTTFWDAYAEKLANGTEITEDYIYAQYGNTKASPFELPPIADTELNRELAKSYPNLGFWGTEDDWFEFFETRTNPVPDVANVAIGWTTFKNNVLTNSDFNGNNNFYWAILFQQIDPMDYVEMLNKSFADIHAEAMKTFGEVYGIEIK